MSTQDRRCTLSSILCRNQALPSWQHRSPGDISFCNSALASNAIKCGREGGQIEIRAGGAENVAARTAVLEYGAVPGTGPSLPLSLRLVESMGGRIEVSSQSGQGTRFTVH